MSEALPRKLAIVLLGAGRASRFGGPKLAADLAGQPVALHTAARLANLTAADRVVVCSERTPHVPGFRRILLTPEDAPLSRSIALGIAALGHVDGALIALADMPLVPHDHFAALLTAFQGQRVATSVEGRRMVPAVFPAADFALLQSLGGDQGAGALLKSAQAVGLAPALAMDIDTPDDLERAQRALQGR
ncbi:MAG: nucleotidyltransferase family protein [Novosphingobium sp.]